MPSRGLRTRNTPRRTRLARAQFELAGGKVEDLEFINAQIDGLAADKIDVLRVQGPLLRSKLAWKFASMRMALIYRICDLAEAVIREWSEDNGLSSVVLARALIETVAMSHWLTARTRTALDAEDIPALDALAMKALFGIRNPETLRESRAKMEAVSVLTMIDSLDKVLDGVRGHYDRLSDIAHPNAFGHQHFYATIDHELIEVNFSRTKRTRADLLPGMVASLYGVSWARRKLDELGHMFEDIADLQERKPDEGGQP
jgi:hypothetical protein